MTTLFAEGSERNKAMGIWGAVAGSGGAAGVLLGGMLTECARLGMGALRQRADRHRGRRPRPAPDRRSRARRAPRHFDAAGAVTVTAGLSLLVYAIVDANNAGWGSTQTLGLGAIALGLIAAFVVIELRTKAPLVPFPDLPAPHITGINVSAY